MSTDLSAFALKTHSQSLPDGDHRKRRRNRSTQSCFNCHLAKRMCDRKRPACSRCLQIGIAGRCVYEVDDPNQATDTLDEKSKLLKRVYQLEGVIRELKSKPYPRKTRRHGGSNPSPRSRTKSQPQTPALASPTASNWSYSPTNMASFDHRESSYSPHSLVSSPENTAYPAFPSSDMAFNDHIPSTSGPDLSSYPAFWESLNASNARDSVLSDHLQPTTQVQCTCLADASNYRAVLELYLCLHKTIETLLPSHSHQSSSTCSLYQHLQESSTLAVHALSSIDATIFQHGNGQESYSSTYDQLGVSFTPDTYSQPQASYIMSYNIA